MVITKIIGGLGNQLFQYSLGRHLAILNDTELKLDVSEFETYKLHAYSLGAFNVKEQFASQDEIARFKKYQRRPGKINFLYNRLIADRRKYVQEKQFHFDSEVLKVRGDAYLTGFWQTEKYFKDIEGLIRKDVTLKRPLSTQSESIAREMASKNAVSLHIRRADYVTDPATNAYLGTCSIEYYQEAARRIADKVGDPHFFLFSDDHAWVKENLKLPYPCTYVDHNGPDKNYEDLTLMSMAKHAIIANSSFSWWGAWLIQNPTKIVIGPTRWFSNPKKKTTSTEDILPENWIRL